MKAYVQPIDRLREALRWFVAVKELQLLHVLTSPDMLLGCLQEVKASEFSPQNRAPFVVLGTAVEATEMGWRERIAEFEENYAALQEDAASADPPLALAALPYRSGTTALEQFAARLLNAVEAFPAPYEGLMVVLAPALVAQPAQWAQDLRMLFASPALARVRWILLETADGPGRALANELAHRAEKVDVLVEEGPSRATLSAMVKNMKTAPPGAESYRLAGMAGPRVAPPPRPRQAPPAPEAQKEALIAAGINPAFGDIGLMHQLRIAVLEAALAFRDGRVNDAAQSQLRARDLCVAAGMVKESALMELVLGAYALQAGAPEYALQVFDEGIQRAEKAEAPLLQVQGHMARGGTLLSTQRAFDAAQSYTRAGQIAEAHALPAFAIESYRMVGQILLQQQREQEAAAAWLRAVSIATQAPAEDRVGSSAPLAARDLAQVYRRAGMSVQANSLEQQAAAWEAEQPPPPAAPEAPAAPVGAS